MGMVEDVAEEFVGLLSVRSRQNSIDDLVTPELSSLIEAAHQVQIAYMTLRVAQLNAQTPQIGAESFMPSQEKQDGQTS